MDEEETDIDDMGGISGGNMETRSKRRKIETSDGFLTETSFKVDESSDILNEMIIKLDTMKKDINNELVNNERIKIINNIFNPNIRREAFIMARRRISRMKGRLPYKKKKSTKKRRKPRRKQRRKPCRTVRECKKKMSIIKNKLKKLTRKKKKGSRKKNK